MTFCLTHDPTQADSYAASALGPGVASRRFLYAIRPASVISLLLFVLDRHLSGMQNIQLKLKDCLNPAALPPCSLQSEPSTHLERPNSLKRDPLADTVLTRGLDAALYDLDNFHGASHLEVLYRRPPVQISLDPRALPPFIPALSKHAQEVLRVAASPSQIFAETVPMPVPPPIGLFLVSRRPSG